MSIELEINAVTEKIAEVLGVSVDDLGPHGPWAKSVASALGMPQEDDTDRWEQECQRAKALRDLSQGRNIEEAKKILEPYMRKGQ